MVARPKTPIKALPDELKGVAQIEDIDSLQEQVDKCYSMERYEDFQTAVEKIVWRYLKSHIGWAVFIWLATLIGAMLLQRVPNVF